jgi:CBS domain-containing protein
MKDDKDWEREKKGKPPEAKRGRQRKPPLGPSLPEEEGAKPAEQTRSGAPLRGGPKAVLRALDAMTEDPVCCTPDAPLSAVARLMAENSCGAIPVVKSRDDRIPVGMLTDRDIAMRTVALGRNPLELRARDVDTPVVSTVEPQTPLDECALRMREHKVRRLVVVDASGRICGVLSQADLARVAPKGLSGRMVRGISEPPPENGEG